MSCKEIQAILYSIGAKSDIEGKSSKGVYINSLIQRIQYFEFKPRSDSTLVSIDTGIHNLAIAVFTSENRLICWKLFDFAPGQNAKYVSKADLEMGVVRFVRWLKEFLPQNEKLHFIIERISNYLSDSSDSMLTVNDFNIYYDRISSVFCDPISPK